MTTVFVNRTLNMKRIKFIGFDMDHTLIRYQTKAFETTVYRLVIERLISNKQYPKAIRSFQFNFEQAIRGLVIDSHHGNILKLSRFAAIRQSYHGTKPIQFTEQQAIYGSTYVDLSDPGYIVIDTAFSIAFCVLYSQLVDYKDIYIKKLPNFQQIAFDVLNTVDLIHADGSLKNEISLNMEQYVIKNRDVVEGLKRYQQFEKKLFIVTNSEYQYTKLLLDYAINPFLEEGKSWCDLFEFVITYANKPRFFYDQLKFLKINPQDGKMTNCIGSICPGIYQGGNAHQFANDLSLKGNEILYIGDHIYGDILRLKKDCNWRTALVVDELGTEIASQRQALPIEKKLGHFMQKKIKLEEAFTHFCSLRIEKNTKQYDQQIDKQLKAIHLIDEQVSSLLKEQHQLFNPYWGKICRAGAEESYLAYQIEHYACIYMEKISDLLQQSPLSYFRPQRRLLAHDYDR